MNRIASSLPLALVLLAAAVSGATAQSAKPKRNPNVITEEELHAPDIASLSARDAIMRLRPNWLRERGATSLTNAPNDRVAKVMLNDVVQDISMLSGIRASEITEASYISAADATTRFGTGYVNGLINITTARKPD
jgi:hypothetical protein